MKFGDFLVCTFNSFWKFIGNTFTISLISSIAIFLITIFMPQNVEKAIEIFKNLLQIP